MIDLLEGYVILRKFEEANLQRIKPLFRKFQDFIFCIAHWDSRRVMFYLAQVPSVCCFVASLSVSKPFVCFVAGATGLGSSIITVDMVIKVANLLLILSFVVYFKLVRFMHNVV